MIDKGSSQTFSSLRALEKWLGRVLFFFFFFSRVASQLMLSSSVGSSTGANGCSIDLHHA